MEEQFVNPDILNELNNMSNAADAENTDFGLEGFFDNADDEEMVRNRENVFGILDSVESGGDTISGEEYADLFEDDCAKVLGCNVRKNKLGEILRIRPGEMETQVIKTYYSAIGFGLLVFLLASSVLPYILIYAGVFGMAFATREGGFGIQKLDALFYDIVDSTGGFMLVNAGTVLISLLLATYCGCKYAKISPKSFFAKTKVKPLKTLAYSSVGFFLQIVASVLITLVAIAVSYGGKELYNADFSTNRDVFAMVVICVYTVVIAPFAEEFFFRGFVLNAASRVNPFFAMVLSSFLFGLYHMNIPQIISAFLMGMLLSYVTLKADSVIPAIIIHAINNAVTMALSVLTEYNASLGDILSTVVIYGLALVGLVVLVVLSRKEALPENTVYDKYRGARVALTCASLDIAVVIMIYLTAMTMFK